MDADTVIIEVTDNGPQLSDIPDTSFTVGDTLVLSLDQFVSDCDDQPDQLQWTLSGHVNLAIEVDLDRSVSIYSPSGWTGSELITFEVSDPDVNTTSDAAMITVIPGTGATSDARVDPLPEEYLLFQNYPNPFNAETEIRYQIPDSRFPLHTTLKVYNVLGQEVRTLVDTIQPAGSYSITWDGRDRKGHDMVSGIYYCRMTAGRFAGTIQMVLLK